MSSLSIMYHLTIVHYEPSETLMMPEGQCTLVDIYDARGGQN